MPNSVNSIIWFRNDLRVADNTALNAAALNATSEQGALIALFVITRGQWQKHHMGLAKQDFILRNLKSLQADLHKLNIPLLIRGCSYFSEVPDVVAEVAKQHRIKTIYWNKEYLLNEIKRDRLAAAKLETMGIKSIACHDSLLIPPGQVLTGQGEMYKVFTPFYRNWLEKTKAFIPSLTSAPKIQAPLSIDSDEIPSLPQETDFNADEITSLWPTGKGVIENRLKDFAEELIKEYPTNRDIPLLNATSQLSPYLSVGALSARQCLAVAQNLSDAQSKEGTTAWIRQLAWRDFYNHLILAYPKLVKGQPFIKATTNIRWSEDTEAFTAWAQGKTGQPFVDAGMRQLRQTGWMHNRLRMITAMFLTKNLFIDWHWGETHFLEHLVDGDFALNNSGWQWSASTGTDAAPYFRVFNPFSQSKRFDPEGIFIKRYVPELNNLPTQALHDPNLLENLRPESYPKLLVDIKQSRSKAISVFSEILNSQAR